MQHEETRWMLCVADNSVIQECTCCGRNISLTLVSMTWEARLMSATGTSCIRTDCAFATFPARMSFPLHRKPTCLCCADIISAMHNLAQTARLLSCSKSKRLGVMPASCSMRSIHGRTISVRSSADSGALALCFFAERIFVHVALHLSGGIVPQGPKKSDFDSTAGNAESQSGRKTGPIGAVVYESHAGSKSFEIRTAPFFLTISLIYNRHVHHHPHSSALFQLKQQHHSTQIGDPI